MILFHFADAPERYFPFVFPALILGSTGSTLTNIHARCELFPCLSANAHHTSCFSIAIFRSTPSSLAGTIGAIWNGVIRLGSPVGLAVASAIQIGVEAKHGGPTSYAGRAASFWFMLALLVTSTIPLLIFYRNETDGNNPSIEEGSEREKVLEGKSNELVISEVLEV